MPKGTPPASQPKTVDERALLAAKCVGELKLTLPVLVDDMQGTAEKGYQAWPDRIVVIDANGKVAYPGERGPGGFRPSAAEAVLKTVLDNGGKMPEGK